MMFSMDLLVRDNIFLVDANNGEAIEELEESSADCDYNIYWPSNTLSRAEVHGIYTNPCLDTLTFAILSTNSPAFQSGLALPGFGTDFTGALRHPEKPCRGAVELLVNDGSITAGDIRDTGGRLIRRVVQGRIQNLGYDGRNRLNRWDWDGSAGTSCSYDYDHAGRRILTCETVGGETKVTRYVYDGADVCAEYEDSDNDGDVDRTRVYWLLPGMDRRIGFAENVGGTNTFYYYLTDHVGTVLRIVKEDGTVVNQYDYDAFGRVRQDSPNTFVSVENRYLFQGREWDKNGGFYYFRNRIYLPERGEFATPDMNLGRGILGELDGMATLTFCGGDPVNCVDPTGLIIKQEWEAKRAELISRGGWWNVVAFGSSLGEAFFDVASLGTFGKNDALVDKNLNGEISDEQLYKGIAINTGVAAASLAAGGGAAGAAGTFVATRTGSFVITGLAAGSAGGFAASSTDVLLTRAGYEGIDIPYERSVGEDVKQVVFTTVFGGGFGILGGAAARYDFYHATKVIPKTVAPANKPVVNSTSSPASAGGASGSTGKTLLPGEGEVGKYNDLIAGGSKGDNITPHHIPSAKHMAGKGVAHGDGISINMEQPVPGVGGRHRLTFTCGTSADAGMTSRNALAAGIRDARSIYMLDDLYTPYIRQQLQEVIRQNKNLYPSIFSK
jgi:RHS repeat-associated protein